LEFILTVGRTFTRKIDRELLTLKYKKPIDKNQKHAQTQKTKIKWDTADKDKYIELVNEGIQSSDLT
jgi:hypothetical protein